MAVKDVKQYYYSMLAQYMEMKADLADFEQAVADGFITEEQLAEVKEDVLKVEQNYERLTYIMYLLEVPNKPNKKAPYKTRTKKELDFFTTRAADMTSVELENKSALDHLRRELKRLSKVDT